MHQFTGQYLPFSVDNQLDYLPIEKEENILQDTCYYTIQADGALPRDFTGTYMGQLEFFNGKAHVDKHYYMRMALMRGCRDVTPPEMKEKLNKRDLKKILLIRNAAFGDCLILTPAIRALKEKYPNAKIHVLGRKDSRVVYENLPFIDKIINFRETEVASCVEDYDEVWDMVHTIECCPDADHMNALDVAKEILGIEVTHHSPIYISTPQERQVAQKIMRELNIDKPFIIFQAEATAHARTLPYEVSITVANELCKMGFIVLMTGHDQRLPRTRINQCTNCGRVSARDFDGRNEKQEKCACSSEPTTWRVHPPHPNLRFLQNLMGKYKARERWAITHHAQLVIAVDSFYSHLAAAMHKPSVIIFSNYPAYTRTKYYDECSVVTVNYEKEAPCGPCAGLFDYCHMYPNQLPPCIAKVRPEAILEAARERLKGLMPAFEYRRDIISADDYSPRSCPWCGSDKSRKVTAKNEYFYSECLTCLSVFTNKVRDSFDRDLVKGVTGYRTGRNMPPDALSRGIQGLFQLTDVKQVPTPVFELVGTVSDQWVGRSSYKERSNNSLISKSEHSMTPLKSLLTVWIDGIMEEEDPVKGLARVVSRVQPGNYLALVVPLVETWDKMNTWEPLNGPIAGLINNIPSRVALEGAISSCQDAPCRLIGINTDGRRSIVLIQRLEDETSKTTDREAAGST